MPAIDIEAARVEVTEKLPIRTRWNLDGTPWDWDFSRSLRSLEPIGALGLFGTVVLDDWRPLRVFGEEAVGEGGGAHPFVCMHAETGLVLGFDIERDKSPVFLLNTSLARFIATFLLFDHVLRAERAAARELPARVREIDADAFGESEWREAADYVEALYRA